MSNFKNVLKVFKMMREFESDDHALLNTLRGATEAEIDLLVETVGPVKRATKRPQSEKCSKCGYTRMTAIHSNKQYSDYHEFEPKHGVAKKSASKSPRAVSLAGAIGSRSRRANPDNDPDNLPDLTGGFIPCTQCDAAADANVHHLSSVVGYHEFQPAVAQAAAEGER